MNVFEIPKWETDATGEALNHSFSIGSTKGKKSKNVNKLTSLTGIEKSASKNEKKISNGLLKKFSNFKTIDANKEPSDVAKFGDIFSKIKGKVLKNNKANNLYSGNKPEIIRQNFVTAPLSESGKTKKCKKKKKQHNAISNENNERSALSSKGIKHKRNYSEGSEPNTKSESDNIKKGKKKKMKHKMVENEDMSHDQKSVFSSKSIKQKLKYSDVSELNTNAASPSGCIKKRKRKKMQHDMMLNETNILNHESSVFSSKDMKQIPNYSTVPEPNSNATKSKSSAKKRKRFQSESGVPLLKGTVTNSEEIVTAPKHKKSKPETNAVVTEATEVLTKAQKSPYNVKVLQEIFAKTAPSSPVKEDSFITSTLREKMLQKLQASRFRYLNEQLYTSEPKEAQRLFREDPEAFQAYHEGYQNQVQQWPINPVDVMIKSLKKKPVELVIADLGCGDAQLAQSLPNKVHSFDLVALSDEVIECNMAHTPLSNASVDVVVFCLSLMGTTFKEFFTEANRVLKEEGTMKIAEVESRFDNVEEFIAKLQKFGFVCTWKDLSHNLFYFLDFKKERCISKKMKKKLPELTLKPCLYKKR